MVRASCNDMKPENTWYVVLGMVVVDLGKAAAAPNALDPYDIFLIVIGGMAGSIVGRNEAVKRYKSKGDSSE